VFGRTDSRTHTDQLLQELTESYGHLKLAAGHAAGGATEKLTPPYDKARNTATRGWQSTRNAFAPIYEQMRDGATNARRGAQLSDKRNRTWPVLVSLLAAGAAVGAAGAMIARRRRVAHQWDEFEPDELIEEPGYGRHESLDAAADDPAESTAEKTSSKATAATKKVTAGAAVVASTVSTQAGKIADRLSDAAGSGTSTPGVPDDAAAVLEEPTGPASQVPPRTPEDVE
jgi:cytoskeletal protein RodZ